MTDHSPSLKAGGAERAMTREARAAADLIAEIGASDDEVLAHDMVEGETSLIEAVERTIDEMDQALAMVAGLKVMIESYRSRKSAAERRADRLKSAVLQAMQVSGMKNLTIPAATLTDKHVAPRAIVSDESKIPSQYWLDQPPKLDRTAINRDAKNEKIPGIEMSNGGSTLQIRRT